MINEFRYKVMKAINLQMEHRYGGREGIEKDAVLRASKKLKKQGKEPVYQKPKGTSKPVKKDGKILPNN
ncbi:hypothetical protein RQM59_10105 [Flavobacteriaceae bacterium S356]|uniref:Small, acid-soluble spore protein, alpha/beta type n=1 Tax=Asprobacillus argus TaxID=3076534 RepID=A0ABU3LGA3_9FLAO|nr:hypothetical protein [Flavobacteriaceae bacterium S356]